MKIKKARDAKGIRLTRFRCRRFSFLGFIKTPLSLSLYIAFLLFDHSIMNKAVFIVLALLLVVSLGMPSSPLLFFLFFSFISFAWLIGKFTLSPIYKLLIFCMLSSFQNNSALFLNTLFTLIVPIILLLQGTFIVIIPFSCFLSFLLLVL